MCYLRLSKKRRSHPFLTTIASAALLTSSPIYASGIFLQEAVVANAGTVGAGDGVYTKSAAAMWTNPATMSGMGNSKTTVNAMAFDLKMDYADNQGQGDASGHTIMPSVGLFHVQQFDEDWHFGIALGTVGGSSIDYGQDWAGSLLMSDITLTALQVNPSASYKVNEKLSLGIGAQLSWASLEMGMLNGQVNLDEDADWAYGFNLGAMYQLNESLDVGFSFRSKLEHDFSTSLSGPLAQSPSVATDIVVPAIYDVSARYTATDKLDVLTSVQLHRWSEWDQTTFNMANNVSPSIARNWDDVWKLAVGLDYQLSSNWNLKTGFSYESSPQDDPSYQWVDLPVGKQYRYSVGASTNWNDYTVDLFYEYADLGDVDMYFDGLTPANLGQLDGTFSGQIHFIGVSVTY